MPRDYESENYAVANGYDLAEAATAWSEEPPEAPEESEAERLSYALYNLNADIAYTRGLLEQFYYAEERAEFVAHIAEVQERINAVQAKLAAALERERAEEGL